MEVMGVYHGSHIMNTMARQPFIVSHINNTMVIMELYHGSHGSIPWKSHHEYHGQTTIYC